MAALTVDFRKHSGPTPGGGVGGFVLWLILHNDYKIGLIFKDVSI